MRVNFNFWATPPGTWNVLHEQDEVRVNPITVVIIDDCPAARDALVSILRGEPEVLVVGEAQSATEGLAAAEMLRPDVVLMDFQMPGRGGAAAIRRVKELLPDTKVLCLLVHTRDISNALGAGAEAYLMKDAGRQELCRKIRELGSAPVRPSAQLGPRFC